MTEKKIKRKEFLNLSTNLACNNEKIVMRGLHHEKYTSNSIHDVDGGWR